MASRAAATSINAQIYEEAADWLLRHREYVLEEAARKSFDLWLRTSPQHIRAYLELSAIWDDLSLLDPHSNAPAPDLIAQTRLEDNVVTLCGAARDVPPRK